jgi:hypothetical protein
LRLCAGLAGGCDPEEVVLADDLFCLNVIAAEDGSNADVARRALEESFESGRQLSLSVIGIDQVAAFQSASSASSSQACIARPRLMPTEQPTSLSREGQLGGRDLTSE